MILAEKIQMLRKQNGYSQEELATLVGVSRQAVSKWEADIALPETEKLILLSNLFQVTVDVLIKDELAVNGIREISDCAVNVISRSESRLYEGILIKESLEDENILDIMDIHKVELWKTEGIPRYWTALYFSSSRAGFPDGISKALLGGSDRGGKWFVDFKSGNIKYVVFRDLILKYRIGDALEKQRVCRECAGQGIPESQMHWPE